MSTSEKSDWSVIGLAHKLLLAWERAGGTVAEANKLAENLGLLRDIIGVLRGTMVIRRKTFPTWRKVRLGVYKSLEAYLAAAAAKGQQIGVSAAQILSSVEWAQEEIEEELVRVSGKDLGLADGYTAEERDAAAATFGLYPCVAEVGPAAHDQYLDQPMGECNPIAMKAVADPYGNLGVFNLGRRTNGVWLGTSHADPEGTFDAATVWLFSRRPPPAASVSAQG